MAARACLHERALRKTLAALVLVAAELNAQKFYDDDPIQKEPAPMNVEKVKARKLSDYYDLLRNTFSKPGEPNTKNRHVPAKGINTLGEVPDSAWYANRHYSNPMTPEKLARGPGNENPPSADGPWVVMGGKAEGITPGFFIKDSKGHEYLLKFDPLTNPEMATAADVISSKFFYALGYNVPENDIVYFSRSQLVAGRQAMLTDRFGVLRKMANRDISDVLLNVPRNKDGRYRAVASFYLSGTWLGPFRYYGTRPDDPNDVVPHEQRRDLRGLGVFCAWLDHDDSRAINTVDFLVKEDGIQFIKHYLIDFGSTLGSSSTRPNSPRSGNQYLFDLKASAIQLFSVGLYVPRWARAHFPDLPSVGRFESKVFDPEKWVPDYRNPAFANRLPDDAFWAAKQVMIFTDDQIRAIVKTGQYSDRAAENWVADCLIARRDKIGKAFFAKVLPLDRFSVKDGHLVFDDLGVKYKLISSRDYNVRWSRFNNETQQKTPLQGEITFTIPKPVQETSEGNYFAVDIDGGDAQKAITVYLRKRLEKVEVVGIDRTW